MLPVKSNDGQGWTRLTLVDKLVDAHVENIVEKMILDFLLQGRGTRVLEIKLNLQKQVLAIADNDTYALADGARS